MHTFEADDGTLFHRASDLSGMVTIQTPDGENITVAGEALLAFVGQYVLQERIARLEQQSYRAVLGLDSE